MQEVASLGVALRCQVALDAEVTGFLGRERHTHGERAHEGSRNGYSAITVKMTDGRTAYTGSLCHPGHCGKSPVKRSNVWVAALPDVMVELEAGSNLEGRR